MAANNSIVMQPLDCANLATDWPRWKQQFKIHLVATEKHNQPENNKIATFLWLIGDRGLQVFNSIFPDTDVLSETPTSETSPGSKKDAVTLSKVLEAFDSHCVPRKNIAMEAFKLNLISQQEGQPFSEFETALRSQIQHCDYNCSRCKLSYADRMMRDRVIIGVNNKDLQLKLLDRKEESLAEVIDMCKVFEAAEVNKRLLESGAEGIKINAVNRSSSGSAEESKFAKFPKCFNCGKPYNNRHRAICPASNVICHSCGKRGHFKKCCRMQRNNGRQINLVNDVGDNDDCNGNVFKVPSVNSVSSYGMITQVCSRWLKEYWIKNSRVTFKLDTGAEVNCVPKKLVETLKVPISREKNIRIIDYSSNKISTFGQVKLVCVDPITKLEHVAPFVVVDNSFEPLLGLDSCINFGLIERVNNTNVVKGFPDTELEFVNKYADLFSGLGKCPGTCSIVLKEDAVPVLHYRKRIPHSLHDRLKSELDVLIQQGIISPVDYPTDWVNNIQIVEKPNGSLRICLDPKPLNACIKREHFLIPRSEDLISRLSGKRIFTVMDLRNGFWHMELDGKSSNLTTFMTPFGRFRWNRLPFGINSAPELFQKRMCMIFGDIPGVEIYFDDIAITGMDYSEHDIALEAVIKRAREYNIRFNPKKIQYRKEKVRFMGHVIENGEVKPDQCYTDAIMQMPRPSNKSDVLRLLGLCKYLGKFIPNLSQRTAQMRHLTGKQTQWSWSDESNREWKDLLESVANMSVLSIFDPDKAIVIQTDSSKDGLGSVLLQDDRPIAYASRTLSKSEQKWAQIEKELLAIVFACQRFHYYLYGRDFTVHSDHKPLEALMKRDIDDVTPRLQRMFMFLLKYPGMIITYRPGKQILIADCLSRAPLSDNTDFSKELSGVIHSVVKRVIMSPDNTVIYARELHNDHRYSRIVEYVQTRWPVYHQLDDLGQAFYKYKHELHFEDGLLFKDHKLVVPTKLQNTVCSGLHKPHLGIEKTLARGRALYFWPGMTNDITQYVQSCSVCEKFSRNNSKEPLVQESVPAYPFSKVGVDIFEYAGGNFISIVDAYSCQIFCEKLLEKSSRCVMETLQNVFYRFGYPSEIRCDNVPFGSHDFRKFANDSNIFLSFSSPRYPQSNGLAEKGVAIVKNILKRCYEAGDVNKFQYRLLEYNTTPIASTGLTPTELFFGRQLKTCLPCSPELLKRNTIKEGIVREKLERKSEIQKRYYDDGSRVLPVLNPGETAIFKKNGNDWVSGTVIRNFNGRSYIIKDKYNNHFRRNRKLIKISSSKNFKSGSMPNDSVGTSYYSVDTPRGNVRADSSEDVGNEDSDPLDVGQSFSSSSSSPDSKISLQSFQSVDNSPQSAEDLTDANESQEMQIPYTTNRGRTIRPPKRYVETVTRYY